MGALGFFQRSQQVRGQDQLLQPGFCSRLFQLSQAVGGAVRKPPSASFSRGVSSSGSSHRKRCRTAVCFSCLCRSR